MEHFVNCPIPIDPVQSMLGNLGEPLVMCPYSANIYLQLAIENKVALVLITRLLI